VVEVARHSVSPTAYLAGEATPRRTERAAVADGPQDLTFQRSPVRRFGAEVRRRRLDRQLSLSGLAHLVHFNRAYIGRVETGERLPSRQFARLCDTTLGAAGSLLRLWDSAEEYRREREISTSAVQESTRMSRRLAQLFDPTPDAPALAAVQADVHELAVAYLASPPAPMFRVAAALRAEVLVVTLDRHRISERADLVLALGQLSGILAYAALDLGRPDVATVHAQAAWSCGQAVGHNGLRAWARGTQSLISRFVANYPDALTYVQDGKRYATEGTALVRLLCGEAQSYANLGDSAAANRALNAAESAREKAEERDVLPGLFTFGPAKQCYYAGSSLIWLDGREDARRARDKATSAIELWQSEASEDRSHDDESLAHVYLSTAQLQLHELDGATEALAPVLALSPERRISWLVKRLGRVTGILSEAPYRKSVHAQAVREQLIEFCAR
jgi:tetratricopeptide (TPR) repeat protein